MDHCTSVSDAAYRQRLRSASSHEVSVPRHRLGRLSMDVVHLPLLARLCGTLYPMTCGIRRLLRTVTGGFFTRMRYINPHWTLDICPRLLDGLLHSDFQLTASSFCRASFPRCASTQLQLVVVWASDICRCRPNCLELTER